MGILYFPLVKPLDPNRFNRRLDRNRIIELLLFFGFISSTLIQQTTLYLSLSVLMLNLVLAWLIFQVHYSGLDMIWGDEIWVKKKFFRFSTMLMLLVWGFMLFLQVTNVRPSDKSHKINQLLVIVIPLILFGIMAYRRELRFPSILWQNSRLFIQDNRQKWFEFIPPLSIERTEKNLIIRDKNNQEIMYKRKKLTKKSFDELEAFFQSKTELAHSND